MNILIIGGTRLLGLTLVRQFVETNHNVTVLSRRAQNCPDAVERIEAECPEGLTQLLGRSFDITIDFIAYDETAPAQVSSLINPGTYILISSTWMVRLAPSTAANRAINAIHEDYAKRLPDITYSYLTSKMRAEACVLEMRKHNSAATILRLPIFWGYGEHTGRLDFYCQRVSDNAPVICVDGGKNVAQIAWTEDIARAMIRWLERSSERPIWEALPDSGTQVREMITQIAAGMDEKPNLVSVSSAKLLSELPEYLEAEPLWRERAVEVTSDNIFVTANVSVTPQSQWLGDLARGYISTDMPELRLREISLLEHGLSDNRNS